MTFKAISICQKLALVTVKAGHMHNLRNPTEVCMDIHPKSCSRLFITPIFVLVPNWKLPKYLSKQEWVHNGMLYVHTENEQALPYLTYGQITQT